MSTKIKLFRCGDGGEKSMEINVNKFIENKDVISVSTARNPSSHMDLVVTYKE
jgi:hypothetical protein